MSAAVLNFKTADQHSKDEVVAELRALLARAEAGEIVRMSGVVEANGVYETFRTCCSHASAIFHAELLKFHSLRKLHEEVA